MRHQPQHQITSLTRRRFLQGTLGGVAGLAAWQQGWLRLGTATAQKREPSGQMTWAVHVQIAPTWFDPAKPRASSRPTCSCIPSTMPW